MIAGAVELSLNEWVGFVAVFLTGSLHAENEELPTNVRLVAQV